MNRTEALENLYSAVVRYMEIDSNPYALRIHVLEAKHGVEAAALEVQKKDEVTK